MFSRNSTGKVDKHMGKNKPKPWPKPHTTHTWGELSA